MDILQDISSKSFEFEEQIRAEISKALSGPNIDRTEPPGFQTEGIYFGEMPPKMRVDQYLNAATGWVYACVARISDAMAGMEICLYQLGKNGEDITEITEHPSLDLLDKVNNFTTRIDHFWLTQEYLELAGEAPWFVSRGKNGDGEPESILLLRPDRLTIVQNDDKSSNNPVKEYKYRIDAQNEIIIKPNELIFLKYPDPVNYFRGKGTLQAAATTVDIDNFSEEYNRRFFYNSARPDMVLASDQKLSTAQRQQLQTSMRKLYQGGDKAHKTLVLESGLKATPFSISQKDMDFLEQQRYDMAKIFSIFGTPKSIMSISDDVNLANAQVGEYIFAKYTIKPKMQRIVAQLNEFFLPMFKGTEKMYFAFKDPVPDDRAAKIQLYDSALTRGYMTINEVRAEQNLEDVGPEGDKILIPNNIVPIEQAGQAPVYPAAGLAVGNAVSVRKFKGTRYLSGGGFHRALRAVQLDAKAQQVKNNVDKKLNEVNVAIEKISRSMIKSIIKGKRKEVKDVLEEQKTKFQEFGDMFVKSVKSYEKVFEQTTKIIFDEQKNKILERVPKKGQKANVNMDDWELDAADEADIMVRVYDPLMKKILKEAGTRAARLVGEAGAFDMASKPVQNYLKNRTYDFSFEVNEETNRLLAETLKEGVAAGEGIPELRSRVATLFDDMEGYRAERIARSEVVRGSNFAANEAYDQSGVVDKVQWLATEDDRIDEECAGLDGTIIDLGDSFANKEYYGDVEYPPIHANCRCTIVPIVS